eukprot:gnl/TRDRNA2_/TRDRNA2_192409_c0_seq1.p1 gnl/TRDRNA2_/TRDRNA2_192409_c0~~gnl/TRDRNA2_/TRDRNA2_192409_c0_seq1.p1  ORF type:complete len:330 (+),score=82.51 gnl/TRDRNA2_/TRDRNA2_192409_c0_seq1:63-1052(+)
MSDPAHAASHTSCYTNEEKKDKYDNLPAVIEAKVADAELRQLCLALLGCCAEVSNALRTALVTVEGTSNTFGDTQLTVDVIADKILFDFAAKCSLVYQAASEEQPNLITENEGGRFVLCWDPLDGSSIVDNNWAVGTIVGIWDRKTGLLGATGRDQLMSLVVEYGPRATAIVTLDDGVYEFTLQDGGNWVCSRERIEIAKESKMFSPANLRAAQDLPGYNELIGHWMKERYTLRYTGGLVPDVYQQFTKKQGIFTNPTSPKAPAKLRIAFEAAPFANLVEKAGGKSSDGVSGGSILDVVINAVDQRTPLCCGSAAEVERFNKLVLTNSA